MKCAPLIPTTFAASFALSTSAWAGGIPISAPTTIASSGSYYLTQNLSPASGVAIQINANDVTIDLNGHTITLPADAGGAINASFKSNIRITNGSVRGGLTSVTVTNAAGIVWIDRLAVMDTWNGIKVSGQSGAPAQVVVAENVVRNVKNGRGIEVMYAQGGRIENNVVSDVKGTGLFGIAITTSVSMGMAVRGNIVAAAQVVGVWLYATTNSTITQNTMGGTSANNSYGLWLSYASNNNVLEGNTMNGGGYLSLMIQDSNQNLYANNRARGNVGNTPSISGVGNTNAGGNQF